MDNMEPHGQARGTSSDAIVWLWTTASMFSAESAEAYPAAHKASAYADAGRRVILFASIHKSRACTPKCLPLRNASCRQALWHAGVVFCEGGDIVKSSMKNRSVTYRKTMKTLPLVEDPAELWRGGGRKTQPYSPPP